MILLFYDFIILWFYYYRTKLIFNQVESGIDTPETLAILGTHDEQIKPPQTTKTNNTDPNKNRGKPMCSRMVNNSCLL